MKVFVLLSRKSESSEIMSIHQTEQTAWKAAEDFVKNSLCLDLEEIAPYKDYIEAAQNYGELTDYQEELIVEEYEVKP